MMHVASYLYLIFYAISLARGFSRSQASMLALERQMVHLAEEQRRELGQDLHDGLGQLTHGLEYLVEALWQKAAWDPALVGKIRQHSRGINARIRDIVQAVYPVHVDGQGFPDALQAMIKELEETYPVRCRLSGLEDWEPWDQEKSNQVLAILAEAMHNAVKHAKASVIELQLRQSGRGILISICNDGVAHSVAPSKTGTHGLSIMEHRAQLIGATLSAGTAPDGRFCVEIELARILP